jgi:GNAT superfamily N-acetyltransferase
MYRSAESKSDEAPPSRKEAAIRIRRAHLSDYPAIQAFIRESYGVLAPFKSKQRWEWQFQNNPFTEIQNDEVPVWIAEIGGRVIGQIAVQMGLVDIDGRTEPAGWVVDVMILPSYRGLGLGHQLYTAVVRDCPFLVTLTMAPATRRMAEKQGAVNIGEVKVFSRLCRLDRQTVRRFLRARAMHRPKIARLIEFLCKVFSFHSVIAALGSITIRLRDTVRRLPRTPRRTRILEVARFSPEIDTFWQTVRCDFPVAFTRDSKFLNWRFPDCAQLRYRCFTASRGGDVVGYLVLRETESFELSRGIIVDMLAARSDVETIAELITFAIEWFGQRVAAVQCATSVSEFASVLRAFGFLAVTKARPNAVVANPKIRRRLNQSSGEWLLSKADHDWDQIHPAVSASELRAVDHQTACHRVP